jgi:DNA-binding winged helix-turn-helix (wHTH) protein
MSKGPRTYDPVKVEPPSGRLGITLLGSLSLRLDGTPVVASAPKQRQVLALLALNVGRVVTSSALIEELWGDRPPRSHATTLQTYVLQLRNALDAADADRPGARQILSTRHSGYLLEEDACTTDVQVFERRVRAGYAAAEAGDQRRAAAPPWWTSRRAPSWRSRRRRWRRAGLAHSNGASRWIWRWAATPTCWVN